MEIHTSLMEKNNIQSIIAKIDKEIQRLSKENSTILIAIDGRCAAGKTTLAAYLQTSLNCNIFHMDHFFLRPEQRTSERLEEPGGNVDYERFLEEIIYPLKQGKEISFQPYDCHTQSMGAEIKVEKHQVNIVEGSYSCHPTLFGFYNLTIFLTVDRIEQMRRIRKRNGEQAIAFQNRWIPLEERYFSAFSIKERCDLCIQME